MLQQTETNAKHAIQVKLSLIKVFVTGIYCSEMEEREYETDISKALEKMSEPKPDLKTAKTYFQAVVALFDDYISDADNVEGVMLCDPILHFVNEHYANICNFLFDGIAPELQLALADYTRQELFRSIILYAPFGNKFETVIQTLQELNEDFQDEILPYVKQRLESALNTGEELHLLPTTPAIEFIRCFNKLPQRWQEAALPNFLHKLQTTIDGCRTTNIVNILMPQLIPFIDNSSIETQTLILQSIQNKLDEALASPQYLKIMRLLLFKIETNKTPIFTKPILNQLFTFLKILKTHQSQPSQAFYTFIQDRCAIPTLAKLSAIEFLQTGKYADLHKKIDLSFILCDAIDNIIIPRRNTLCYCQTEDLYLYFNICRNQVIALCDAPQYSIMLSQKLKSLDLDFSLIVDSPLFYDRVEEKAFFSVPRTSQRKYKAVCPSFADLQMHMIQQMNKFIPEAQAKIEKIFAISKKLTMYLINDANVIADELLRSSLFRPAEKKHYGIATCPEVIVSNVATLPTITTQSTPNKHSP